MIRPKAMAPSHPDGSSHDLAAIWRARLDKAKATYDLAVAQFRRSAEEYRFRESDGASESDLRAAIAAENTARAHYLEVLHAFTELIVNGTLPPEIPVD
jgi:hypothetical protein